jgi:hypothetical protein
VERLEHRARVEDEERLGRAASDTRHDGGSTLVHARAARRVLQEVLALDRGA